MDLPKLPTKLDDLDFQEQGAASDKRRQHPNCPIYSAGILPYGVCSSWNRDDKTPSRVQPLPAEWGPYDVWDVHHCFLCTFFVFFFPPAGFRKLKWKGACARENIFHFSK